MSEKEYTEFNPAVDIDEEWCNFMGWERGCMCAHKGGWKDGEPLPKLQRDYVKKALDYHKKYFKEHTPSEWLPYLTGKMLIAYEKAVKRGIIKVWYLKTEHRRKKYVDPGMNIKWKKGDNKYCFGTTTIAIPLFGDLGVKIWQNQDDEGRYFIQINMNCQRVYNSNKSWKTIDGAKNGAESVLRKKLQLATKKIDTLYYKR